LLFEEKEPEPSLFFEDKPSLLLDEVAESPEHRILYGRKCNY